MDATFYLTFSAPFACLRPDIFAPPVVAPHVPFTEDSAIAQFDLSKQAPVGSGGSLAVRDDGEIARKLSMLIEGECKGSGPIEAAWKFGYSKQRYFQLRAAFLAGAELARGDGGLIAGVFFGFRLRVERRLAPAGLASVGAPRPRPGALCVVGQMFIRWSGCWRAKAPTPSA